VLHVQAVVAEHVLAHHVHRDLDGHVAGIGGAVGHAVGTIQDHQVVGDHSQIDPQVGAAEVVSEDLDLTGLDIGEGLFDLRGGTGRGRDGRQQQRGQQHDAQTSQPLQTAVAASRSRIFSAQRKHAGILSRLAFRLIQKKCPNARRMAAQLPMGCGLLSRDRSA
jgi:hypothetical protein